MNNLRNLRLEYELNMRQVADALNIPYTTYVSYEKGDREPNCEMLIRMADFYLTTVDYILNKPDSIKKADSLPLSAGKTVPLLHTTVRGADFFAEENIETLVHVWENIQADFALRFKGDSMTGARIFDNDTVYIRKQETVENGEIAAVLIDNEITLKRCYRYGDTVVLRAENPDFKEIVLGEDEAHNIKVLGKAVYFFSRVC